MGQPELVVRQDNDAPPAFPMVGIGGLVSQGRQVLGEKAMHVFLVEALAIGLIDELGRPHLTLRAEEGQPERTTVEGAAVQGGDGDADQGKGAVMHGIALATTQAHVIPDLEMNPYLPTVGPGLFPRLFHIWSGPGARVVEGEARAIEARAAPLPLLSRRRGAIHDLLAAQTHHHVGPFLDQQGQIKGR